MESLTLQHLLDASRPGGASSISFVTELAPAAGPHSGVAPARYVSSRNNPTYLFQTRFIDGQPRRTVLLDSKGSSLNRVEEQIVSAITDGEEPLVRTPRVMVHYDDADLMCLQLPHRVFDGHVRAGTINGQPATADPAYRELRDATPANVRSLLLASPQSLVFGAWDSTRKSHQGRYRSALVGEIIGVLADQSPTGDEVPLTGAARSDAYAPSVQLAPDAMRTLLDAQRDELSHGNAESIEKKAKGKGLISGSSLGLGSIPPSVGQLGVVSCSRIIRTHLLSFSTLRALRFGAGTDGDAACRALLAAFALAGVARVMSDPRLRANCDLVEKGAPTISLDARYGNVTGIGPLSVSEADSLLVAALDRAQADAGITWSGQTLDVVGNPLIANAKADEEAEDA